MTIDELLDKLRHLTYRQTSSVCGTYSRNVINRDHFNEVEVLIRQFANDNHDSKVGELQAKVYAYEKIIANSNFAPILNIEIKKEAVSRGEVISNEMET